MLNYGIIGNCRTSALVSSDGSIDWFCFPKFDGPSAFAKILDAKKGGHFDISPVGDYKITQKYIENTNVLETTFTGKKTAFRIIDFFPCYREGKRLKNIEELHRLLVVDKGKPTVRISYEPKLDYARGTTRLRTAKGSTTATNGDLSLHLYSNIDLKGARKKGIKLTGNSFFILSWAGPKKSRTIDLVEKEKEKTIKYWRDVIKEAHVPNFHKAEIIRSILTLKLLTFYESGGMVASTTTSIPEVIGEGKNFDKRYCWIKDQSLAIEAFTNVGLFEEAKGFMKFLTSIGEAFMMKIGKYGMSSTYRPTGESFLEEQTLEHLAGYRDSRPVRIGNDAHKQSQIAVFGETLDAIYKFFVRYDYAERMMDSHPSLTLRMVEQVIKHWKDADSSIWEFREKVDRFTSSKLMSWVALDRAIKIYEKLNIDAPTEEWEDIREAIRDDILTSYDEKIKTFTITSNSKGLDTSLLLMTHYGLLETDDPRLVSTINAIEKGLKVGSFLRPFSGIKEDGFEKPKNAYMQCALWLIDAYLAIGENTKAKILFEKVARRFNHLGLFSEGLDLVNHEMAGNFPSAYAHTAFINVAVKLSGEAPAKKPPKVRAID